MAQDNLVAIVDRVEWFRAEDRAAALASLGELEVLEKKMAIRPGRPGCIDAKIQKAAALLGLDAVLFDRLLSSAVCNATDPKGSWEYEILASRTKTGGR